MSGTSTANDSANTEDLALVFGGGGARAAYQAGVLRCLANHFPELRIPIITGLSAGAINATYLANFSGSFRDGIHNLADLWTALTPERIFRVDAFSLLRNIFYWGNHLLFGGYSRSSRGRGLVDTRPLRRLLTEALYTEDGVLPGIERKLNRGDLKAIAIATTNYFTGETNIWTQGCDLQDWERPKCLSVKTRLTVDHIMASTAIPIFFPAVRIDGRWHGDGGVRLYAPLSPAIHLGADRIFAISTRYRNIVEDREQDVVQDYPPPAQIAGILMNAVFLDAFDQDADRLVRTNEILRHVPEDKRRGRRIIKLFVLRPSQDLGKLSAEFEPKLPAMFRFLMRRQGARETTASPDWLSMVMFQPDYLRSLVELGEKDAWKKRSEIEEFFGGMVRGS